MMLMIRIQIMITVTKIKIVMHLVFRRVTAEDNRKRDEWPTACSHQRKTPRDSTTPINFHQRPRAESLIWYHGPLAHFTSTYTLYKLTYAASFSCDRWVISSRVDRSESTFLPLDGRKCDYIYIFEWKGRIDLWV